MFLRLRIRPNACIVCSQLTAGHCSGAFSEGNQVLISALSSTDFEDDALVDLFVRNENYVLMEAQDANGNRFITKIENDIAVVRLNKQSTEPLAVWSTDTTEPSGGDTVRVIGFGRTMGAVAGSSSPVLLETTATVRNNNICMASSLFIPQQMACAANPTSTTCRGDSGSPYFDTLTNEIVGVVSFGPTACGVGSTRTMTRVSNYDAWIQDKICTVSAVPPTNCPGQTTCGDGICTPNVEDEVSCPQDCTVIEPPTPPEFDGRCQVVDVNDIAVQVGDSVFFSIALQVGESVFCRTQGANGDADLGLVRMYTVMCDETRTKMRRCVYTSKLF